MKIPKVGDVVRIKLDPDANGWSYLDYVARNGEVYVVVNIGDKHMRSTYYDVRPIGGTDPYRIELYPSEITIEPLLTAVYKRKHGHPKSR